MKWGNSYLSYLDPIGSATEHSRELVATNILDRISDQGMQSSSPFMNILQIKCGTLRGGVLLFSFWENIRRDLQVSETEGGQGLMMVKMSEE